MPKMIDADKLQDWIDRTEFAFYGRYGETGEGVVKALGMLKEQLDAGHFDPTPPVQPDIPKLWDKVRHKDHPGEIGEVWEQPRVKARFEGQAPDYYRLDELEVITDEQ